MPCWQSLLFQPLGTQILGKFSWWMKHLKRCRVCPAKRLLWRCPSRRLLRVGYPLLHRLLPLLPHLPHQDQDHAGEWISGGQSRPLAPASMPSLSVTVAGCYDSTPGDLYRSLTATSAQLRLRSPGWVWRRSQWRRCQGCYIQSWSLQRDVPSWPRLTALSRSKAGTDARRHWVFHQLVFSVISLLYKYFRNVPICPNISPLECYIVLRPCN